MWRGFGPYLAYIFLRGVSVIAASESRKDWALVSAGVVKKNRANTYKKSRFDMINHIAYKKLLWII